MERSVTVVDGEGDFHLWEKVTEKKYETGYYHTEIVGIHVTKHYP